MDNNFHHDSQLNVNDIIHNPSDFHIPNNLYNICIPAMNQESAAQSINYTYKITNDIQINQNRELPLHSHDTFDNDIPDNLFENSEQEVMFNYDEVDEDELEEQHEEESNKKPKQRNNNVIIEESDNLNEDIHYDDRQEHESKSIQMRQPTKKYQDFY